MKKNSQQNNIEETPDSVEEVLRQLQTEDWSIRLKAAYTLARLDKEVALQIFTDWLSSEDSNEQKIALNALREIDDNRSLNAIIRCFADDDEDIRTWAASNLSEKPIEKVLPLLEKMIFNKELLSKIRSTAVWALHELVHQFEEHSQITQLLLQALEDDDQEVRQAAIDGLGRIGDPEAVKPVILALGDEDEDTRWIAASALGKFDDPQAVNPLIQALSDKSDIVREFAAISLGYLGDRTAVVPLRQCLNDKNPKVKAAVQRSLERLEQNSTTRKNK